MERLKVKSFGPIDEADVHFGDLTLLVGPQASGKSIFLQLLKLLCDPAFISRNFDAYSFVWSKNDGSILDLYFGEGMSQIWTKETEIIFNTKAFSLETILNIQEMSLKIQRGMPSPEINENLFYIPAQRILSISDGRPKPFTEFDLSIPFVLRHFSEMLRFMFQQEMRNAESFFPLKKRLPKILNDSFNESIFHDGKIVMEERNGQKKLRMKVDDVSLTYMTWKRRSKGIYAFAHGFLLVMS